MKNIVRAKFGTLLFFVYPSLKQSEKESAAAERAKCELWFFFVYPSLNQSEKQSEKEKEKESESVGQS